MSKNKNVKNLQVEDSDEPVSDSVMESDTRNHEASPGSVHLANRAETVSGVPTLGETRIGVDFNPSRNPGIDLVKFRAAELVDQMHELGEDYKSAEVFDDSVPVGEVLRLTALAMTHFEEGAMLAVKAHARAAGGGKA